jgi:hypothetical protein
VLRPSTPEQLAALADELGTGHPASSDLVLDAAQIHTAHRAKKYTAEQFGRYCATALPSLLQRLLTAESDVVTLRAKVAGHVAAADQGLDPTTGNCSVTSGVQGSTSGADVTAAVALIEGEARAAAFD